MILVFCRPDQLRLELKIPIICHVYIYSVLGLEQCNFSWHLSLINRILIVWLFGMIETDTFTNLRPF